MKKTLKSIAFIFLGLAAAFYLFILPPLVATNTIEQSLGGIAFAAFLLMQLWMLVAEFAYESASAVFGFKRKRLFIFLDLHKYDEEKVKAKSGFHVLTLAFLSYLFMVYGFGVLYIFISNAIHDSFSIGSLSFIEGMYFSLITSSTVGYGDITPTGNLSRLIVMVQVILSMAYVVMLFSSAVSYIGEGRNESPNK